MKNDNFCDKYIHITGSLKATEKPKLIKYLRFPNVQNKGKKEGSDGNEDKKKDEENESGIGCVWRIPVAKKSMKDMKASRDRNMGGEKENENENDMSDIDNEKDEIQIYW